MRRLRLGGTGIETSELGFGCADLVREPSRHGRRRLLDTALDAGICHFDVAPMYTLGLAEAELGRFAQGRRDRVVIATKFGIEPTPAARMLGFAQAPVQRLLGAAPGVRERARPAGADPTSGRVGRLLYRRAFDVGAARVGLERSLQALRTDHLDILFVHDPLPAEVESDAVAEFLESARAAGRIRAWGVAGEPGSALAAAARLAPSIPVLQLRRGLLDPPRPDGPGVEAQATIRFGVIARALPRILAHVRADESTRRRWSDAVGADCADAEVVAPLLLRDALDRDRSGPVLFGTIHTGRIEAAARAASGPLDAASLERFRALVTAEVARGEESS
jgi:D-threo-aldose 1-dehydrogenase